MRVLVSGGAGFIGSHLADALLADGHLVAVLDDLSTGHRQFVAPATELVVADIASPAAASFVARWRPDALLHQAAHVSVRESIDDPRHDASVNVLGSVALLQACHVARVRHMLFASTGGAMYGTALKLPTPEAEPATPASPYGCAKLAVEGYLGYFSRLHGMRSCALRYANVYGPRQSPHGEAGVVASFADRYLRGEIPTIHGDGSQTRDYVHVDDLVRAVLGALRAQIGGVFDVGTGVETTVREVSEHVRAATGAVAGARHGPEKPGDAARSCLDASALRRGIGWESRIPLAAGLAQTVAWFRANR